MLEYIILKFIKTKNISKKPINFWKSIFLTLHEILGYLEAKFYYSYLIKLWYCNFEQEEKEEEEEEEYEGEEEEE